MEREPNPQPKGELTVPQFRQQLNQWFEEHGVLDNLRSHLRSLMITAIQHSEISLKAHQKTSPKSQSIDLLVAEYLLKHGCHYTLSILMSELPCLANFCSGKLYLRSGPNTKSKARYHFQGSEVVEILNCLGLSKHVETGYNQSKEESLLECLLRLLPKIQLEESCKKTLEENRNVEKEDHAKMMRELNEREKRIQEYLRRHREEMLEQLQVAERNLDARREAIEKEVTERQLHLGRIAFQWKDKHEEIMALSKHFMVLKTENESLRAKLDDMEDKMNQLELEIKEKTEVIDKLEAEKLFLKNRVREYLKLANKGTKSERERDNIANKNDLFSRGVVSEEDKTMALVEEEKCQTLNLPGCPGDCLSLSDTSFSEEALLEKVKLRLRTLEEETFRISERYLKYREKYDDDLNLTSEISDVVEEAFSKTLGVEEVVKEKVQSGNVSKKETAQQVNMDINYIHKLQETPAKKKVVHTEDKALLPTKRQEQNREYYLKSRQFLEVLEKNSGLVRCSSTSSADISLSYSLSSESLKSRIKDEVVGEEKTTEEPEKLEHISERKVPLSEERKNQDLTDKECLALLQEATHTYLKTFEIEDEVHTNS